MKTLIAGLVLFLGTHSISIVAPALRDRLARRLGEWPWKGIYSLASAAGFALIVGGFASARATSTVLYVPPLWLHGVAVVLLVPVFPMALSAYLPGQIEAALKHPMLAATKTWALAHLFANGSLADVILFGAFLAWAVADRLSLRGRTPRPIATAPPRAYNDALAVLGGLALYAVVVFSLHLRFIGVAPLG